MGGTTLRRFHPGYAAAHPDLSRLLRTARHRHQPAQVLGVRHRAVAECGRLHRGDRRTGVGSIEGGQSEAARSIRMRHGQILCYILLPQSLRAVVPPTTNELITLVKGSALLSVISVYELTRAGQAIIAVHFAPLEIFLMISIFSTRRSRCSRGCRAGSSAGYPSGNGARHRSRGPRQSLRRSDRARLGIARDRQERDRRHHRTVGFGEDDTPALFEPAGNPRRRCRPPARSPVGVNERGDPLLEKQLALQRSRMGFVFQRFSSPISLRSTTSRSAPPGAPQVARRGAGGREERARPRASGRACRQAAEPALGGTATARRQLPARSRCSRRSSCSMSLLRPRSGARRRSPRRLARARAAGNVRMRRYARDALCASGCDRVLFMDGGAIVEEGVPEALIDAPREERTKKFLAHLHQ